MAPKYKLSYFDITALAEPIRFLFSYGGIEFEDFRVPRDEWPNLKSKMPFGQMPVLEFDGKVINQSIAIARYVAKLVKLAGKDDFHDLEIDSMVDNINDVRLKIGTYAYEADEVRKQKELERLTKETLPFLLGKLDDIAKANNGYFVRGELSWADVYFTALLDYENYALKFDLIEKYPNLQTVKNNVLSNPGIKNWIAKRPKTDF